MIKNSDITVIIQGPYYKNITNKVLNNICKLFKGSKIILSTYNDKNISIPSKNKFKVLLNNDPKKIPTSFNPLIYHNYFGQIRTTLNGILNVKTKYCLKVRSDIIFKNKNFLKFFDKYKKNIKKYKILEKKVILSSFNTIDPRKEPLPFHFSDWFYFGKKKDLLKIFNQNYMSKKDKQVPLWFFKRKKPKYYFNFYFSRYRMEQHITVRFLQKFIDLKFQHAYDYNSKNIILTEKILTSNFIVLDTEQISFKSLKHPNVSKYNHLLYFNPRITFSKWLSLYKKYCDNTIQIKSVSLLNLFRTFVWVIFNPKGSIYRYFMYKKIKL